MALRGVKVLELSGLAPGPFCGMILADFGATVTRIDKARDPLNYDTTDRGKKSLVLDLKQPEGANIFRKLSRESDVIIEPYRTGVMEKLNLGPDVLLADNPKLIYARLTGYGQTGPLAKMAGHDINYLSISGVLSRLGRKNEPPIAPINLLADFAGGGMTCAMGIMAALIERNQTGKGQVIDSNMVEGSGYVSSWLFRSRDSFIWNKPRGENLLDTGTHFYETYETKDGKYMAVGAIEPQFYSHLLKGLELSYDEAPHMTDFDGVKKIFKARFLEKTRDEWTKIFDKLDACVTPVLEFDEVPEFPHNAFRKAFIKNEHGRYDPVPAPRLANHEGEFGQVLARKGPKVGEHTLEILQELGYSGREIQELVDQGAVEFEKEVAKL